MERRPSLSNRAGGILLHPTSLPGPHGIGDLGSSARRFAELLAAAGQSWWQMLPIHPPAAAHSPYAAFSVFAGSPLLISLDRLAEEGWLEPADLVPPKGLPRDRVNYPQAQRFKEARLEKAFGTFEKNASSIDRERLEAFAAANVFWLPDYALFCALKEAHQGAPWVEWEGALRLRQPEALAQARRKLDVRLRFHIFVQHQFSRQWSELRDHCRKFGLGLLGDVPIYAAHDSAEVWAKPQLFSLDGDGRLTMMAGVPPDYFSKTGQLWGNPLYRWDVHRQGGYEWWVYRLRVTFDRFDAVRLDHFIGFQRYWEIPAGSRTAQGGRWVDGPGADLFDRARDVLGSLEIAAEDLGAATPEVFALRDRCGFPGLRVLQFAFGGDSCTNDHLPHRYPRRCVVYTGTHDNETTAAWFRRLPPKERRWVSRYAGTDGREIHWDMIRLAWMSPADVAIAPAQDLLGLGSGARMNLPGTVRGNWRWRLTDAALTAPIARRLRALTEIYGRIPGLSRAAPN
ncbi:MAG: 4-alpha-glucanotransferase [Elusimicrobia bacterium]|nr:4-alpha-glucanotransferase [Elusimicrobiota bacterium]